MLKKFISLSGFLYFLLALLSAIIGVAWKLEARLEAIELKLNLLEYRLSYLERR